MQDGKRRAADQRVRGVTALGMPAGDHRKEAGNGLALTVDEDRIRCSFSRGEGSRHGEGEFHLLQLQEHCVLVADASCVGRVLIDAQEVGTGRRVDEASEVVRAGPDRLQRSRQ